MWKLLGGVFLGWGLGANDSANIFGTGVATRLIKYSTAVILISLFVIAGSLLEGSKCMDTVGKMADLTILPWAAFIATMAAALTIAFLTFRGLPVSASQAIIGAVAGIGFFYGSTQVEELGKVVLCWILAPVGAMIVSYALYKIIGFLIETFLRRPAIRDFLIRTGFLLAGCYGAYTLGANNVANTTGVYVGSGLLTASQGALIGGLSIALGALTYSRKVMETVGEKITPLDPFSAFITQLSQALTLHVFTQLKVPVSASQAVVGAIIGVGLVKGARTVSAKMVKNILLGWVATPVASGVIAFLSVKIINNVC